MKKYLIIALALAIPAVAFAAENLSQRRHGGALWVQNKDGTNHPVGGVLTTDFTNLVSAATKYIRAHKTGNIMKVYSVLQAAITDADATITVMSNNSDVVGAGEAFTNTGHSLTVANSGSAVGDIDSSVLTSATTATKVSQGDLIAIQSGGGSGGGAGGLSVTIVIE